MNVKNKDIELRSVKLMSKEDSQFKRYLLEIPVHHLDSVANEEFWPTGVRGRIFKGRGNLWEDREETDWSEGSVDQERENNNSAIHSN